MLGPASARAFAAAFLVLVLVVVAAGPLLGQGRSLRIESFDVRVEVREDAAVEITESIRFRFDGSWNGVYRLIPIEYRTPQGFSKSLLLDVDEVRTAGGRELRYEESRDRHYRRIQIWVPDAQDRSETVVLRYASRNALLFFENHDELYWNVTGDEWEMPIERATATVVLPDGATGLRSAVYTGAYGARLSNAAVQELEDGFYFETTESLAFKEGMTVVVGWDPGVVDRPSAAEKALLFLRANWLFLLPLLSIAGMAHIWWHHGKDPARLPVAPRYEPPAGMTAAELGTLIDNSPDPRDLTATVVDLAVRGYLRIEEVDRGGLAAFFGGTEYRFVRTRSDATWNELLPHEREVLEGIFSPGGGDTVRLSDLKNEFYRHIPDFEEAVFERLVDAGFYEARPDEVMERWLGIAVLVGGLSLAFTMAVAHWLVLSDLTAVLAAAFTALPVFAFAPFMPARTGRGARRLEQVLGFEEFLDRVESDRFKRMIDSPDLFEAYLPFAMALGVEEKWARAFDGMLEEPPEWFVGQSPGSSFRPSLFVNDLGRMTSSASGAMTSSPRSSGGSGFSGGSSGGGGGGGGGGGF